LPLEKPEKAEQPCRRIGHGTIMASLGTGSVRNGP
jgi:hypothetical protein